MIAVVFVLAGRWAGTASALPFAYIPTRRAGSPLARPIEAVAVVHGFEAVTSMSAPTRFVS